MYDHKFEPADGLLSAKQIVGNISASEDKLKEGEEIANQLVEDFGKGEDLAVRVGYDNADGLSDAVSRLEAVTKIKERLEDSCEGVKEELEGNVDSLQRLVLGSPGAAASAIEGNKRAAIGAVVLQLLALVVTDLPAVLEEFPSLRDALSADIVANRQTQISSGQVDGEQLEDLRTRVESLNRKCADETDKANTAVKDREEAESRLVAARAESGKLKRKLTRTRDDLKSAKDAAASTKDDLDRLRKQTNKLEQDLSSEQVRATRYREERQVLRGELEVSETNAENHKQTVLSLRKQLDSEREKRAQETRRDAVNRLQKDLDAERASHVASRDSHAKNMSDLKASHQAAVDRMQGQIDELRSEASRARHEISGKDTELGKIQGGRERLETRLARYKIKLDMSNAHVEVVRSDMQKAREEADRVTSEKEEAVREKDAELGKARDEIARLTRRLQNAATTSDRLRRERDDLRESKQAKAASSDSLEDARREITALKNSYNALKVKYGEAEYKCAQADEKVASAESQLSLKEDQLRSKAVALRGESRRAEGLRTDLRDRELRLRAAVQETELVKNEVEELKSTIEAKQDLVDEKSATIRERDAMLKTQKDDANREEQRLAKELEYSMFQTGEAEARLSDKERELESAKGTEEQLLEAQDLNDRQNSEIESLRSELEGLRASGSARVDEITENSNRASLFLAEMAGLSSMDYMFGGLVSAIFQRDDVCCTLAARVAWRILESWDESPAEAAEARSLVPRDANLQVGVVLLLGEAISGRLNTRRSQAILHGLVASAGSEDTQKMPMAILTELAHKVIMAIREAKNVPVEFSLTFWQLMELVERRIGGAVPRDSTWHTHKGLLFAQLTLDPCSLVLRILQDDVRPESDDHCRMFGDSICLCSQKGWQSVVVFDTDARTLRFVEKTLVSTPGLLALRIGPKLGHAGVDMQLQPSDTKWLILNV